MSFVADLLTNELVRYILATHCERNLQKNNQPSSFYQFEKFRGFEKWQED